MTADPNSQTAASARKQLLAAKTHLLNHLVGLEPLVDRLLIALLSKGHILIEGPPGVAKTRTIKQFAQVLEADFVRIQATPDLLPADLTGTDIYQQKNGEFTFLPGPLFNNIILVDEVNRAPPKVQSALLEAMGEHQISTSGITRKLEEPFLVAATQNPIEHEGTYPLPEAQLDRFMFFVNIDLPNLEHERQILDQVLSEHSQESHTTNSTQLCNTDAVIAAREEVAKVHLSEAVRDYIVRIVGATRGFGAGGVHAENIAQAASPRASINIAIAAQAAAWIAGRDHIDPNDIASLAPDILCGRISLNYKARATGLTNRSVVQDIIEATPRV